VIHDLVPIERVDGGVAARPTPKDCRRYARHHVVVGVELLLGEID
jgi:hypothetical protein